MQQEKGLPIEEFQQLLNDIHDIGKNVIATHADDVDKKARFPTEAFDAFKSKKLLSCYVPQELGGMGLSIQQVCSICETLGGYCASTAMIFAMHQIQVACIVHHFDNDGYFKRYLRDLVDHQYIMASATTEMGVGGDLRSSICALNVEGNRYSIEKNAPVISYGKAADVIMVTCRRDESSNPGDQVQVLVFAKDYALEQTFDWDTLGFRGTCSEGFILKGEGNIEQIQPAPFGEILEQTMHPVAHLTWSSLWLGLAQDAAKKARATAASLARKDPGITPISAIRFTELDEQLYLMRSGLYAAITEYQSKLDMQDRTVFQDFSYAIRVNNVKLRCSEMLVDIVSKSLLIVGISGYKNNSKNSLSRHIRDAYGAAIMVNNDRIRGHNATMHIALRE
jgi:acyl-CoA dehydrogenase